MALYSYKDAQMVIGETDPVLSRSIGEALRTRGLTEIAVCRNADELRSAMKPVVDVVLCDVDLPGMDFCETAQHIRQSTIGANPFTVLIATARPSAQADVGRVIKSGIDDFLIKPMTGDLVLRRLGAFTEGRKPFVATDTYIGPSRRAKRREDGSDDETIEVPNTLRSRVVDNARLEELRTILTSALDDVDNRKSETRLKAIVRLTQRLVQQRADHSRMGEIRRTLHLLVEKSEEVVREHGGTKTEHVADIARRIIALARHMEAANGRPGNVEISLLAKLSDAVMSSFTASAAAVEISHTIAGMVDKFLGDDKPEPEKG